MDSISTAELLELALMLREDLEDQFQYWLSITFAVIVSSFVAGDRLKTSWKTVIGVLYVLTTVLFAVRFWDSAANLQLYLDAAIARGAEWNYSGPYVFWMRLGVVVVGVAATLWFLSNKSKNVDDA